MTGALFSSFFTPADDILSLIYLTVTDISDRIYNKDYCVFNEAIKNFKNRIGRTDDKVKKN